MTVCRDCCCGSSDKHPGFDHDAQLAALRGAVGERHRVRVSECLRVCERSNVVVVHPAPAARRGGARVVHLGDVLDERLVGAVADWLDAGGPGLARVPAVLMDRIFDPADHAD
ncbi:hypothetical protein [Actinoplanes sp. NPDC049316]|uniref:hypothetical protein n=1 Tax=Actinoplanes sp. NPDC049316 TaxID=3154727 RepID=UPI00343617FB